MSRFRSLSYKSYLSDSNVRVPRETKRRRQQSTESFQLTAQESSSEDEDNREQSSYDTTADAANDESPSTDWVSKIDNKSPSNQ
jgi:hypothetical protein